MNIRVVTLRYNESLGGFPEEPLRQVLAGGNVVEEREYFFTHGGVPHLTLVLVLDSSPNGRSSGEAYARNREDPGTSCRSVSNPCTVPCGNGETNARSKSVSRAT